MTLTDKREFLLYAIPIFYTRTEDLRQACELARRTYAVYERSVGTTNRLDSLSEEIASNAKEFLSL